MNNDVEARYNKKAELIAKKMEKSVKTEKKSPVLEWGVGVGNQNGHIKINDNVLIDSHLHKE